LTIEDGQLAVRGPLAAQIDPTTVRINGASPRGFSIGDGNQKIVFSGAAKGCLSAQRFDGAIVRGCVR